jgi:hypothetical protein
VTLPEANQPKGVATSPMLSRLVCVALVLVAAATADDAPYTGDNLHCRACGVVMEQIQRNVLAEMARQQNRKGPVDEGVEVLTKKKIETMCDDKDFKEKISDALHESCKIITRDTAQVLTSVYEGEIPTIHSAFGRVLKACTHTIKLCDERQLADKPYNKCDACLAVVQDIKDVAVRRKGKPGYRTRRHIADLLDDECHDLAMRHPPVVVPGMQRACETLTSEFEDELIEGFANGDDNLGRTLCGPEGLYACKTQRDDWEGVRSPFAYGPAETALERDEL